MESLIPDVKKGTLRKWANGEGAEFWYIESTISYHVIKATPELNEYVIGREDRNTANCPLVAVGFVAYLIRNWRRSETDIYEEYFNLRLSEYKLQEGNKPGAFKRDFAKEFYKCHISEEKIRIESSKEIYKYISQDDLVLIRVCL